MDGFPWAVLNRGVDDDDGRAREADQ